MSDSLILYQGEILKYGRTPNNFGALPDATFSLSGDSPICGDHITLYLKVHNDKLVDISFDGEACCSICKASASMMGDAIKGKSLDDINDLKELFLASVNGQDATAVEVLESLGDLKVFTKLKKVPSRIECAILGWNTLHTAINHIEENNESSKVLDTTSSVNHTNVESL